jgi:hypothetical protein
VAVSPISRSRKIHVWWLAFSSVGGDGHADCCSYVWCLAVGRRDDYRQRHSSFDFVMGPRGRFLADVPQSLGLVATFHRLEKHH